MRANSSFNVLQSKAKENKLNTPHTAADRHRFMLPIHLLVLMMITAQALGPINFQAIPSDSPRVPIGAHAPTDTPVPIVSEIYNEWTLNAGLLYWAERCYGGELLWPATLKRMPTGGGVQRTLATTDSDHCYTFLNMVADSDGVYYYAGDAAPRLEFRSSGSPMVATTIYSLTLALQPVGERLAVDGNYVYWLTTNNRLVRVRKDGTDFGTVAIGLSGPVDLIVVNGVVYYLDGTGLWRTNVLCGTLPCAKNQLSAAAGQHLAYYSQSGSPTQAGPRLLWIVGQSIHRVSCSDITIFCFETTPYTVPPDGNPWQLGRPATDGVNLFWQEGYSNVLGTLVGRLRRMPLAGGTVDDIATNLYYLPGPVYIDAGNIYFSSADNGTTDILKLPLNAAALVRDLSADALEVTQGIQNLANDTPLIADKTTYVRAYAVQNSGPSTLAADAELFGTRNGQPLPGSPLHPINGKISIVPNLVGLTYDRGARDAGWLYQLPASWIQAGNISLRLVVDPLGTYTDPNRANNELTQAISFNTRETVCNIFIPVRTNAPLPSTNIANFWQMIDYAKRLWPTASFRSYHQDEPIEELEFCSWHGIPYPCFGPYELPEDTWKVFIALGIRDALTDNPDGCSAPLGNTHFVGMVEPSTDTGTTAGRGKTSLFNIAWVKFSTDLAASNDPFAPESGETLAHEIAHNLGRKHVDCGDPDNVDHNYPYPTNAIDNVGHANHYGFDVKSLSPIAPLGAKDFMSYCWPKWTSDYTWKGLFNQSPPSVMFGPTFLAPNLANAANAILISGAVTPTANTGELGYAWNFPTAALSAQSLQKWQQLNNASAAQIPLDATATVTYHVRLLDAANHVLANHPVTPVTPDFHEAASPTQDFLATFPAPIGTVAKIELLQDNTVLASRQPGMSVPTVSIVKPSGGEVITDHLTISWQAQDANRNDILHYAIQYSPDNGQTWRSIATDVVGPPDSITTSLMLPHLSIPGSSPNGARLRVAASDGYNTGLAVSQPFTVTNRKPEPFILTPGQGETTPADQSALLRGEASDAEDGGVSGMALSWTVGSQAVGTGEEVQVPGLAPGTYPVTLTARDSLSQTAAAHTALTVLPLAIPNASTPTLDGFCDDAGYATANQILLKPYSSGNQASVRLLRDNSSVWACFTGLMTGTIAPGAFVGVRIDVDHSRDHFAQASDYSFLVGEDGGVLTMAGNGAGGFANPGPGGLLARISAVGSGWSAELRIDATKIGGLDHIIGLSAGHYSVNASGDDYVWPYNSVGNQPETWASTALAALPQIVQLNPHSATVGDLGFTLVISGQDFLDTSQVLWNGTPLSTTFGDRSVISATINPPQLSAAGTITVVVRNPGAINSGPMPFVLRNPRPVVISLSPSSTQAEGPDFTLHITGNHFVTGAKVFWNGQEVPTTFVNAGQLMAQIDADRIFQGRVASVTVLNPGPGAEVSVAAVFTVLPKYTVFMPVVVK